VRLQHARKENGETVSRVSLVLTRAASILFLVILTASFFIVLHSPCAYGSAVIWTDKPDYAPGETVTIFGSGFTANTNILLTITRPDLTAGTYMTLSNTSGNFAYYYALNGILGTYVVTATDGANSATTTFTDAVHVDFKQYANIWDLWINSILQSGKSTYYEGMSVPQRVIFEDIASTISDVHTLTLSHQATKGGKHAYDWLTGWNQGNVPPLGYTPCGDEIGPHATTAMCQALHAKTAPYEMLVDVPDDPFISKDGSTQTRIDAYEAAWGNRQIRICGNQPITSATFSAMSHDVANGGDTGDSFILYTLTWTSSSDQILIELAGHLAMSWDPSVNPIAWGVGLGAGQISGGPFHFKLDELDCHSLGSQDNQIMGADIIIPAGHIIVHKITIPSGDPADFTFDPDYQVSSFLLSDGEHYDSGAVLPGTYHVQELALAGWDLTELTVTDPDLGSSVNLGTGTATIDLDVGETVHVYYTNTKRGRIIVDKITFPGADPQSFSFSASGPNSYSASFGLTDVQTPWDSGWLKPGSGYSVTETVPGGWDLTSVTVNGFASSNGASLTLNPGQILYVNFADTEHGVITCIVDFCTDPADVGSISFQSATYTNGQSHTYAYGSSGLATANVPSGYTFAYWEVTGNVAVSSTTDNPTTFTVTCGGTLKAVFNEVPVGPPVGGEWIPINKAELLLPWIISASLMATIVISFVSVKRIGKQGN
jgi:hypothetical protein